VRVFWQNKETGRFQHGRSKGLTWRKLLILEDTIWNSAPFVRERQINWKARWVPVVCTKCGGFGLVKKEKEVLEGGKDTQNPRES